jgi:SulP family sulfate permease
MKRAFVRRADPYRDTQVIDERAPRVNQAVVGVVALAVILGLRFTLPKVPGALVLVVGGLAGSVLLDLGTRGVALVGPVPRGLPLPQVPSLEIVGQNFPAIIIASLALLLIGFSQTAGDAQVFATRHRYRVDLNQESIAQGMANLGAGLFQGMPVSTSLSASSLNESAGARTPVASLATGAIVGILSGASPLKRGLRQLAIGYGAAAVTYLLGLLFGTTGA